MRRRLTAFTAAAGLCVVFSCAAAAVAQQVGGYRAADAADPEVVAAAEFAVGAQKEKQGGPRSLVSVSHAEIQVVAGRNYRLCLEVKAADETDAEVESETGQAVVYQNLQRAYSLKSWAAADCAGGHSEGHHASAFAARPADRPRSLHLAYGLQVDQDRAGLVRVRPAAASAATACSPNTATCASPSPSSPRTGRSTRWKLWHVVSSGFSSVGKQAEWRVTKKGNKVAPERPHRALQREREPGGLKQGDFLSRSSPRSRRQQICVTDKIGPSATANEDARRAADASADKPCLAAPTQNH